MPPVTYEVSATVRKDLSPAFESFMIEVHIPEVLATGAFTTAQFSHGAAGSYRASYTAPSHEALRKYLVEHSPRLREDMAKHFPEGVEFSREEWSILATLLS